MTTTIRTQEFLSQLSKIKCNVTFSQLKNIDQESDLTKKTQLISAIGKRGANQLNRVEKACIDEITYLLHNLKPSTVSSSITGYRRAIKAWNEDHASLKYFKLPKDAYQNIKSAYADRRDKDRANLKPFKRSNIKPYIDRLISMLSSDSYITVAMGICGLTGRRPNEVLTTATFEPAIECKYCDHSLIFTGQLKTKDAVTACDHYEIPVLCDDETIIISALARLRKMKDFSYIVVPIEKTLGQCVNSITAKGQAQCVQKYLSEFLPNNKVKPYDLRALYVTIAKTLYATDKGINISESLFYSELLGHSKDDKDTFKAYEDFKIEN
jgi:hypothetical protein